MRITTNHSTKAKPIGSVNRGKRVTYPTQIKVKTGKFDFESLVGNNLFARLILKLFIKTKGNLFFLIK